MKVIEGICVSLIVVLIFVTLGIVGGNEQGEISNKDMMIWTAITIGISLVLAFVAHKIEERDYLTEEEYEELRRKEDAE